MPARKDIRKILIPGSGPIVIGQACEFDYSGTQAVRALKEEGYEVILVNPNPATIMTTPGLADAVYTEPLTAKYVEMVIQRERPQAILSTMGGQTGLNLCLELERLGVLKKYSLEMIGARPESIHRAENRMEFKKIIDSLNLESPRSGICSNLEEARNLAEEIGFPLIIRPSFTLGGMGGAVAESRDDYINLVDKALRESPIGEALIDESLIGWKEFELEVMRDAADNAVIVCSIENIDPMGVHTGDSITIAPAQTLSDPEYQAMRSASIDILRAIGVDCGGANVQFAVDPSSNRMVVIEMNPRVSRSSALASKATGFPIARGSAKLAVGCTLDEVINEVTGLTSLAFEPVLDYCAVKVPRFETAKFREAHGRPGTQMKSVGEALALGRTAIEALNKAIRATENGYDGLVELEKSVEELEEIVSNPHPQRLLAAFSLLHLRGEEEINKIMESSGYNRWFLHQLYELTLLEKEISKELSRETYLKAKRAGISDKRIGRLAAMDEAGIQEMSRGITPSYHMVDTCAGEFEASTPYFYSTWGEHDEVQPINSGKVTQGRSGDAVIIIASGPNRIGQGLEFDTSCTLASLTWLKLGRRPVMINSNPETVSTDYNSSSRLYMEPLVPETVMEIIRKENFPGVMIQLGGQTALNIGKHLHQAGVNIIGTDFEQIQRCEDRKLFSLAMQKLQINQPENRSAHSYNEVLEMTRTIGFPLLMRPSYVIGGRRMTVVSSYNDLEKYLDDRSDSLEISRDSPLLIDQFLEDAVEFDVDAICDGQNLYLAGIMKHIEAAGVHSGDSAAVFPPNYKDEKILDEIRSASIRIAREFEIAGLLNIQFAIRSGRLFVLEVNPRASRTLPFLSKATGVDLMKAAVRVWEGDSLAKQGLVGEDGYGEGRCATGWAIKEAVFSFGRFSVLDPVLGPEMKSTGEVMATARDFGEAFAKAQEASGVALPTEGKVFVSVKRSDRATILPIVRELCSMGFDICATRGTANFLYENDIFSEVILKVHEGRPNILDYMNKDHIQLIINTPSGTESLSGRMRANAVLMKIPFITTTNAAEAAVDGIRHLLNGYASISPLPLFTVD